jgi:hypothetical protein
MKAFLQNLLRAAGAAALLTLAHAVWEATPPLVATLRNLELASARTAALIGDTEKASDGQPATIARLVRTTDATVAAVQPVLEESARTVKAVQPVLDESQKAVKAGTGLLEAATEAATRAGALVDETKDVIIDLRASIDPIIQYASKSMFHIQDGLEDFLDCGDANAHCFFNRWAGISWQTEQTLRAITASANRVERAIPTFLSTWDRIGQNSDKTTQATAEVMGNFAAATKPLPTWMRLGLNVAPPVVQVGATVATTMAIRGKHK